jgi:hypothetical protein
VGPRSSVYGTGNLPFFNIKPQKTQIMECNPEYSCLVKLASLYNHNVLINGDRWAKFENTTSPMSQDEVITEIKQNNCDPDQLIILGYSKGWTHQCP